MAAPGRALYYECFAGIAGDMHLGALIDIGVPAAHLQAELARLPLADEFALVAEPASKMGIGGTKATVRLADVDRPTRRMADIEGLLSGAGYAAPVLERASAMFRAIAEAEADIHGTTVDRVHFHEVGATDSIVDVVGAAVGLEYLRADAVFCSPVELGSGMVRCEHGLLPVPAPATAAILAGVPCNYGGVDGEATTPTGAAILKCAVHAFEPPGAFTPEAIGYGIGHKDFARPNVLRLTLGEVPARTLASETNIEVECNIDDMPAEAFGPLMDGLLAKGARDVFLTPIVMKKSRPGTKVSVLVDESVLDAVLAELFAASTTIGVRLRQVAKRMLPRQERTVATSFGDVRVKVATLPNGATRWKSEHDDVAAIATRTGTGYLAAKEEVDAEVGKLIGKGVDDAESA